MLQSRFFWRLYLTFAILVLIATAGTGFLVHQQLQAVLYRDLELQLLNLAHALSPFAQDIYVKGPSAAPNNRPELGHEWPRHVQERVVEIGRETDTRISLMAPDGEVIADSQSDPATMENHRNRPEIVAALIHPYGLSKRFSETVHERMLYVALAVRKDARILGTVRTAIPLTRVGVMLRDLRATISWGAAFSVVLAMGVGLLVARRITAPIAEITNVAEALSFGAYNRRVESPRADEFGMLGATINRLADELTKRISTLAQQRAQLSAMIAGLQAGVIAVDDHDHLIFRNETASELLGLLPDAETSGRRLTELAAIPGINELMTKARAVNSAANGEVTVQHEDAAVVLDARATPFATADERGIVVVLYDITNLRRLEKVRTDFVANVSHELKTPLTAIAGFVDTLADGAIHDDRNNMRFLAKVEQQVLRLDAMVTDLLSLARIESADEPFLLEPVDWLAVVNNVVEHYRDQGYLQGLSLAIEDRNHQIHALGESEAMRQVLDNLLGNAIKYTPEGGSITVQIFSRGEKAVLEVQDSGSGITAADQERIFERFFRADKARSRGTGGTGLGLSIVKHLMQRLHGDIEVESEIGRGSLFRVILPLANGTDTSKP